MLDIVRNLVSSIFGKILLAIMVLSFALWGVGDILSSGNSQLAAKVGKEKITLDEFYNEFQITVRNYNQNTKSNLSMKEAYEMQLHNALLNELIFTKMVNNYAKSNNIYVNTEALEIFILNLPQFKNDNGEFSKTKYKTFILNNFQNEELFLNQVENLIYQGLIFENFSINNFINSSVIDLLYNFEGEKRSIRYFLVDEKIIDTDIDENKIKDFYEKNKNNYLIDKKIIVDYIEIKLENYKDKTNIENDIIKDYYVSNIDLYTVPENRDIEFIRFSNKSDAEEYVQLIRENDDSKLELYINSKNLEINSINNFNGDSFPDEISKEIFNLKINEFSDPIEYQDIGFYIFKIKNINEKKTIELKDVKTEIADYLASENAFIKFDENLDIADEMLINDYSFSEISSSLDNILIKRSVNLDLVKPKININLNFNDLPIGHISEVIMDNNTGYIFKIKDKINSYIPDFEEIYELLLEDYIQHQKIKTNQLEAEVIVEKQNLFNYKAFIEYANKQDFKLLKAPNLERSNDTFSNDTINKIFRADANSPFIVNMSNGEIGVGFIEEIIKPDIDLNIDLYNAVKNNIENNFNASIEDSIGREIIEKSKYEIYNQNIDRLFM